MGKPFKSELLSLNDTHKWVVKLDLNALIKSASRLKSPIYFVGSGGSLSACYFGVELVEKKGLFAKAVTPLELYSLRNTIKNASVIFISASGKNSDILFAFKTAIEFEAKKIISICMQKESKLALLSKKYTISDIFEYSLPVGKDGFLATNSLISYYSILYKVFDNNKIRNLSSSIFTKSNSISTFVKSIDINTTITVLYNGWSKSVAYDIESKSVESALYPILLSDYRNFGHGRHHWFAKKTKSAAVIALATPEDNFLAHKTISAIPSSIPKLILETKKRGAIGALELLVKSFYLVDSFGEAFGIDPGRPGVPEFGRKLYNLKYATALKKEILNDGLTNNARNAILRKVKKPISIISKEQISDWLKSYNNFIKKLNKGNFGAIVFDYDGTICSDKRKYDGPDLKMATKLEEVLNKGFCIGVVTGRGKSVRKDFQNILPKEYWDQVLIGYYNGSEFGMLNNDNLPNLNLKQNQILERLSEKLFKNNELEIDCALRPNQLTIEFRDNQNILDVKERVIHILKSSGYNTIQILESSHSVDIIPSDVSKNNILKPLKELLKNKQLSTDLLCIGDRGKWPGNDFDLLNTEFSLSVLEVSNSKDSCWNLAPLGITHTDATIYYLNRLKFESSKMKIKITR